METSKPRKISHSASFHGALDGELITSLSYSDTEEVEDEEVLSSSKECGGRRWSCGTLVTLAIGWRPHRLVRKVTVFFVLPLLVWTIGYLLFGDNALPGGTLFALFVLGFGGIAAGKLVQLLRLPALLGMLTVGLFIRNVPYVDIIGRSIDPYVSSCLRQLALVIILIKAGVGLDPEALIKLKGFVLALAFIPSLFEALVVAIGSKFILDFPWSWAFLLGFIVSAVSPAVIVPCLLALKRSGYGMDKGISTIVVAVASLADILSISLFGVTIGFVFATGGVIESVLQGPVEVIFGVAFGLIWGYIMGIVVLRNIKRTRQDKVLHVIFTLGGGVVAIFGFQYVGYPGAGPLACVILAFVAGVLLRKKNLLRNDIEDDSLSWAFGILWLIFQPLLFGLIGAELDVLALDGRIVGFGAVCLLMGIIGRFVITYSMLHGSVFSTKEKTFVTLAWIPKATVQAALGPVALDAARRIPNEDGFVTLGLQVLTIAVVAILLTAPLGSSAITILGPKLLIRREECGMLLKASSTSALETKDKGARGTDGTYGSLSKIYVY